MATIDTIDALADRETEEAKSVSLKQVATEEGNSQLESVLDTSMTASAV